MRLNPLTIFLALWISILISACFAEDNKLLSIDRVSASNFISGKKTNQTKFVHSQKRYKRSSDEVVCEARGRGTTEFKTCPSKPCHANLDCWVAYGKPQQCVCDPHFCGLVCLPVGLQCSTPHRPVNGIVNFGDLKVGDTADYSCATGFTVMGPRKRHCLGNLRWSGPEPICTNQTDYCFSPPYMPNAVVLEAHKYEENDSKERNDYQNGETVTMTCCSGFEDAARKYSTVLCVGNQWKYKKLDCQRITCPEINGPHNGRTLYTSDMRYQATAVQFCNDGYTIKCPTKTEGLTEKGCTRVCQADGTWSEKNADCNPVKCPQLQKPQNGYMSGYRTKVNSLVAFECDEGFELVGSNYRTCKMNGQWDGDEAFCKGRDCGVPPNIPYAVIKYSSTTYNSKAYFKCDAQTVPSTSHSKLICKQWENKTMWIPQPYPACYRHCTVPTVENTNISIDPSYQTNPVPAGQLHFAVAGMLVEHGSLLKVSCHHGYNLTHGEKTPIIPRKSSGSTMCNDGQWNVTYKCSPARCLTRPPNISNALVRFYSLTHGSLARYQCLPGHRLNTALSKETLQMNDPAPTSWQLLHYQYSVKCEFGQWTGQPPECTPIHCNRPQISDDVQIHLIGARGRWPFDSDTIFPTHGAAVEFSCTKEGHRIQGHKHALCVEGVWSPPIQAKCKLITHDIIPQSWLFYHPKS